MANLRRCLVDVDQLTDALSGFVASDAASVLSALGVRKLSHLETRGAIEPQESGCRTIQAERLRGRSEYWPYKAHG